MSEVEILFKTEETGVFCWCEKYGITVKGWDKEDARMRMERALRHLAKRVVLNP